MRRMPYEDADSAKETRDRQKKLAVQRGHGLFDCKWRGPPVDGPPAKRGGTLESSGPLSPEKAKRIFEILHEDE